MPSGSMWQRGIQVGLKAATMSEPQGPCTHYVATFGPMKDGLDATCMSALQVAASNQAGYLMRYACDVRRILAFKTGSQGSKALSSQMAYLGLHRPQVTASLRVGTRSLRPHHPVSCTSLGGLGLRQRMILLQT